MTPERYQRIGQLFDAALEQAPEARAAFLAAACGDDVALRAEVEQLLAHQEESEQYLAQSALHVSAALLAQGKPVTAIGRQIRHYQLLSLLGAGGMGEVWLAQDTQLERKVALKLLPAEFTRSQAHVRRFAQEAKAASALSHPNIITIHEIGETTTDSDGTHYIVTEYVEGKTLRQLLTGPMPLSDVLDIALQIADALVAAHQAGIIHRDLKPENVMVRPDGLVKVLDFGLAKLLGKDAGENPHDDAAVTDDTGDQTALDSSSAAHSLTIPGTVMGTISYMSPEQALAQPLDQRTDIFSFGVMLYEMVTGQRPFLGNSNADVRDAILHYPPPFAVAWASGVPPELRWILERALAKNPAARFQTAAECKAALKRLRQDANASALSSANEVRLSVASALARRKQMRNVALAAVVLLGLVGVWRWLGARTSTPLAVRAANFTQLTTAPGQELYPSLSPDGKMLVYASDETGNWDIYLQRVNGSTPINLTKDALANDTQPAFSPDGERIVFRSEREGGGIFVMGATGENVHRLLDHGQNPAWSPNGQEIAFSNGSFARPSERGNYPSPLQVLTIATGAKRQITTTDAVQPSWSPHGDRIAYWGNHAGGQRDIWTVSAQGGESVAVTNDAALDWNPVWSPDGRYLYFASDRGGSMNLWRIPVEEKTGKVLGEPEAVTTPATYSGYISFSRDGRYLAYAQILSQSNIQSANFDPVRGKLVGNPAWITQGSRIATDPNGSPDGEWVVFGSTGDKQEDLYLVRRDGTGLRKLTDDKFKDRAPVWLPDGQLIVFFSDRSGRYEFWTIKPDGSELQQYSQTTGPGAQAPLPAADGVHLLCNLQWGAPLIVNLNQPWAPQTPQQLPAAGFPAGVMFWSWSSDGRKVVGHGKGIYSYSFDTQQYEQLTELGEFPRWLPDNQRLVFFAQDKLYLLDSHTRKTQELLQIASHQFQSLNLSRAGRALYYSLKTIEADIWLASLTAEP